MKQLTDAVEVKIVPVKIVCAYCKTLIRFESWQYRASLPAKPVSHGMCQICYASISIKGRS